MKKIFILSLFISCVVSVIFLPGCKKERKDLLSYSPIGDTKQDSLRLYNLLPDISNNNGNGYVLYFNDSLRSYQGFGNDPSIFSLVYGVPPVVTVPPTGGTFTIKIAEYPYLNPYSDPPVTTAPPAKKPDPKLVVCQKTITLPPHSNFGNVILYDSVGKPAIKYIPIASADPGAPAAGNFKIRVINFSYAMAALGLDQSISPPQSAGTKYNLQLQYADSTAVKGDENVPFGTISAYKEIGYGTEQFLVYNLTGNTYINNSGPLNDVLNMFGLSPIPPNPGQINDNVFPSINNYQTSLNSTLDYANIGSYPFSAGSCYTITVIGGMYSVSLDRRYGPGVLDNFGKVQVVNTNPDQQDMAVKINYSGGETDIPSLPFGKSTDPVAVPAGTVNITFTAQGKTIYAYSTQVPRLGNYTYYYADDLNQLPFVLPESNTISSRDYIYGSYSGPAVLELSKFTTLDMCPDAGNIFFTVQSTLTGGLESKVSAIDIGYKGIGSQTGANDPFIYDGTIPPTAFNLRLTASRPDSLASKKVATLTNPFKRTPAPGTYTLVAAGLLNTTSPAKAMRLIMVKHTNLITKAKL